MADIGSVKDDRLVLALAAGKDIKEAAAAAGVSQRTVHRRLEAADFRERVNDSRGKIYQRAIMRLVGASTDAVDALKKLLDAKSENVRLGAARTTLELATKLREFDELLSRVEDLERIIKAKTSEEAKHN